MLPAVLMHWCSIFLPSLRFILFDWGLWPWFGPWGRPGLGSWFGLRPGLGSWFGLGSVPWSRSGPGSTLAARLASTSASWRCPPLVGSTSGSASWTAPGSPPPAPWSRAASWVSVNKDWHCKLSVGLKDLHPHWFFTFIDQINTTVSDTQITNCN